MTNGRFWRNMSTKPQIGILPNAMNTTDRQVESEKCKFDKPRFTRVCVCIHVTENSASYLISRHTQTYAHIGDFSCLAPHKHNVLCLTYTRFLVICCPCVNPQRRATFWSDTVLTPFFKCDAGNGRKIARVVGKARHLLNQSLRDQKEEHRGLPPDDFCVFSVD